MNDAARLSSIRADLAAIAPARWSLACDANGEFVEAAGPMGELLPVCRIDPGATHAEKHFIVSAPETARFLLGLVDRAIAAMRPAKPVRNDRREAKDYAAEAAMKCAEPAFKAFLEAEHGLERPLTDDRCAQKLRTLCGVTSRKDLNRPGRAADAWVALRQAFEAWKRRERR